MEHVESRAQQVLRRHPVRVTIVEPRRPGLRATIRELWRYRRYTSFFGRRLLAKRYLRTWLGIAWLPLRPTLSVSAKLLVFGGLVGISSGKTAYPVFFLAATAAWQLFAEAAFWSTRSLDVNRSTLRIVHVPRVVVIVSSIVPSLVDFAIHLSFALLAVAYYLIKAHIFYLEITPRTPLFVLGGLGLIAALGVGIGLVTAGVGARARDVRFGLVYSLGFLYYLTPVIYPFSNIPDMYKPVAELNPVTGAMELFKVGLFRGEVVSWKAVLVSVIAAFLLWGPGLWLFQRREVRDW
ncbi:MAG TPA: ABC transporter permease [Gaiellaceae bacterium]|nr:ABC transporter permease [Gaiellaceae bacterium]